MASDRADCPNCGREMIFVAIAVPSHGCALKSWMCDCDYRDDDMNPPGLITDIVRSREWDEAALSMSVTGPTACGGNCA